VRRLVGAIVGLAGVGRSTACGGRQRFSGRRCCGVTAAIATWCGRGWPGQPPGAKRPTGTSPVAGSSGARPTGHGDGGGGGGCAAQTVVVSRQAICCQAARIWSRATWPAIADDVAAGDEDVGDAGCGGGEDQASRIASSVRPVRAGCCGRVEDDDVGAVAWGERADATASSAWAPAACGLVPEVAAGGDTMRGQQGAGACVPDAGRYSSRRSSCVAEMAVLESVPIPNRPRHRARRGRGRCRRRDRPR